MARIRQNVNMAKAGKITQARALERIEELLDQYELSETLWGEESWIRMYLPGHSHKNNDTFGEIRFYIWFKDESIFSHAWL